MLTPALTGEKGRTAQMVSIAGRAVCRLALVDT